MCSLIGREMQFILVYSKYPNYSMHMSSLIFLIRAHYWAARARSDLTLTLTLLPKFSSTFKGSLLMVQFN